MRFTYDNSAGNPRNPFQPPAPDRVGPEHDRRDGRPLGAARAGAQRGRCACSDPTSRRRPAPRTSLPTRECSKADPGNPLRHDAVAMLYLQDGRPQDAVTHLRESLRLNDDSAPSITTWASRSRCFASTPTRCASSRRRSASIPITPRHTTILGAMLHVSGRLDEAAVALSARARASARQRGSTRNLGRLLMLQGKRVRCGRRIRARAGHPARIRVRADGPCLDPRDRHMTHAYVVPARRSRWRSAPAVQPRSGSAGFRCARCRVRGPRRIRQSGAGGARRHPGRRCGGPDTALGRDARAPAVVRGSANRSSASETAALASVVFRTGHTCHASALASVQTS